MNSQELQYLLSFYQQETLPFHYFKDRYAFQLLAYQLPEKGNTVSEVKQSPWAFLLDKPRLKKQTASLPGQRIRPDDLRSYLPEDVFYFDMTFGSWGAYKRHRNDTWFQTSRPGFNLVLQLNFGALHDTQYHQLIQPKTKEHPFRWICHPVAENNKLTMAWARLDVDLENGTVLIEEIQNDWFRNVKQVHRSLSNLVKRRPKVVQQHYLFKRANCTAKQFFQYSKSLAQNHERIWEEATLSACLHFIREELGIREIYYHSFAGGTLLKYCTPPRSLYRTLPRKFGFQKTQEAPLFIRRCRYLKKKLRANTIDWYCLRLN
ncbi:MAG: hypothetical protein AAF985_01805 [Bacteroidota bacterium]